MAKPPPRDRTWLSDFEQLVLLAALRLGDDVYGGAIRRDLEATVGRTASLATIYVALARLETRGFVISWMSDPTPVRGGRSKRCYAITPPGIAALQEARVALERMWSGVDAALDPQATS